MKNKVLKLMSIICVIAIFITILPNYAYAAGGKFISLNISGYDDNQQEKISKNNPFYVENGTVYAPIKILENYTMYDYDDENNAFVRIGQEYKFATSKVVMDYENQKVSVFYTALHKETYDIDVKSFAGTYFLPLSQMAAYLKASVVYKDKNTISIVCSGISLCDATYRYYPYTTTLDYIRLLDDLFVGDESLYFKYTVLGYMKSTIFSFKVSNLVSDWGNYETCCTIVDNAVTNTDVYKALNDENSILAAVGDFQSELYENVYKKANKVYKLSTNSLITMFEEYKQVNSFGDESPFDNFFPEEQLEIDKIKEMNKKVKHVSHFLEYTEYIHKFFTLNDDNRQALKIVAESKENTPAGKAIKKCSVKYSENVGTSFVVKLSEDVAEECVDGFLKKASQSIFSGVNKVKLATEIVSSVFKLAGFDLKDNSSYDVLLASDIVSYIVSNSEEIDDEILNTMEESENFRLSLIMTILVQLEGFEMGNKISEQIYDDGDFYHKDIEQLTRRLSLLYLANKSKKYDSEEGTNLIEKQNRKQLAKLNLDDNFIDEATAKEYLNTLSSGEAMTELIHNFPKYGMVTGDTSISIEIIDLNNDSLPEVLYSSNYGITRIPTLEKIFIFDGQKYVEAKIESEHKPFPVLPKKDSSNKVSFFSDIFSDSYLDEYGEPPVFTSFWYSNASAIYSIKLSGDSALIDTYVDYSAYRNRFQNSQPGEEEWYKAWDEYKQEVKKFNAQFSVDDNYPYTIVSYLETGYISPDLLMEDQLEEYHKTMTRESAEFIVEQYCAGVHEVDFYDYF